MISLSRSRLSSALVLLMAAGAALGQTRPVKLDGIRFDAAALEPDSPSVFAELAEEPALAAGVFPLPDPPAGIVDGDTLRVLGQKESLRLVGLDAEETFKNSARDQSLKALAAKDWNEYLQTVYAGANRARPPKFASPMGEAAKDFAARFFEGQVSVRLEYDAPARKRDYYGRNLVHVLAHKDGRWVSFNIEVARQGLSPYFVKYGRSARWHERFLAAEREAREKGRGIWAVSPCFACYPDYPARLEWWAARDAALHKVAERRAAGEEIVILGDDDAWGRLESLAGKSAAVAGTPGPLQRRGELGLQPISHRQGLDFMIAGPVADVEKLGLAADEGHIVVVHGTVSLHDARPQFRVETVRVERLR